METTQLEGHFSPRQYATVVGMSENSVRLALREGRLTALTGDDGRRWIPEAEITARFALELTSPVTQAATLAMLRRNAATARVGLSPDDDLIRGAELYLRALHTEPSIEGEPAENSSPVEDAWGPIPRDDIVETAKKLVGETERNGARRSGRTPLAKRELMATGD